jgi:hypothetical protein
MAQTQFGRFDKYNGFVGGFRAPLLVAMSATGDDIGKLQAVSINSSGKVVIGGAAETAVMGLICPTRVMAAGDPIDVMTDGEIMDCVKTAGTAWATGDIVYVHLAGTVDAVSTSGKVVGKIVEGPKASGLGVRMVVRCPIATT